MQQLKEKCLKCNKCSLCQTRTNVVFGKGNINADIMFIGEGPGQQEDIQGIPFVGRAGQLLDKMLAAAGIAQDNIYIANIVKCRPPQNRDPLPEEREACRGWLDKQIELINPKVIISLGRISAVEYIDENIKITKEHGQWKEKNGRKYMAMLHPAALLRNPNLKPEAFEDFLKVRDYIENN